MIKTRLIYTLLIVAFVQTYLSAQEKKQTIVPSHKMEWFKDAKLGVFIHWGIYAVDGVPESWSFFNNYMNHSRYMDQLNGFTAQNYQPEQWADLIKASGAKYAVITSKHHDGVALWDSKAAGALTTSQHSAAKKDVLKPFVNALKTKDIKTGIYFSLPDWSYTDYDVFTRLRKRYEIKEEPLRWNTYQHYLHTQLNELSKRFQPDLLWFDGDWEHSAQEWQADKILSNLKKYNPNIIVNSRLTGHGDYDTPEQGVPVIKPTNPYWELCYTMNDSWGYQPYDCNYKSANMIIRTLVDCISMGGNLLLDISPREDGSIPEEQIRILKALGRWTNKHQEAIYGTSEGLAEGYFAGKSALAKDQKTIYLFLENRDNKDIYINHIKSKIDSINIVGSSLYIPFVKEGDRLRISIPKEAEDQDVTVVAVRVAGELALNQQTANAFTYQDMLHPTENLQEQIEKISASIHGGHNPFVTNTLTVDAFQFSLSENRALEPWIIKHSEALFETGMGLPSGHYVGESTLSADKRTLYLFVKGKPTGPIAIKGLKNNILRARIVGEGTLLTPAIYNKLYWSKIPGIVYIPIPEDRLDPHMTVIALLLDGPAALYRENIGAIESNL